MWLMLKILLLKTVKTSMGTWKVFVIFVTLIYVAMFATKTEAVERTSLVQ